MKLFCYALLLTVLAFCSAGAGQLVESWDQADIGRLEFPWHPDQYENYLIVRPDSSGISSFGAEVTDATTIEFIGRQVRREDLDLLTGKRVAIFANIAREGEGEATRLRFTTMTICVLDSNQEAAIGVFHLENRKGHTPIVGVEGGFLGVLHGMVIVHNRNITGDNLDLLNGKRVLAIATITKSIIFVASASDLHVWLLPFQEK